MPTTPKFEANWNSASRITWTYSDRQEVSWIGEGTPLQQDHCRQKEDLEAAQHFVSLAISLSVLKMLVSLWKLWWEVAAGVE